MLSFCPQFSTDICPGSNVILHVIVDATMWYNILTFGYFFVEYL